MWPDCPDFQKKKLVKHVLGRSSYIQGLKRKDNGENTCPLWVLTSKTECLSQQALWSTLEVGRRWDQDALEGQLPSQLGLSVCPVNIHLLSSTYTQFRFPLPALYFILPPKEAYYSLHFQSYILEWTFCEGFIIPIVQNPQNQRQCWVHGIYWLNEYTWTTSVLRGALQRSAYQHLTNYSSR